jgi:predicted ABC-type transport system involved in lysophospholipase L1 biosynthesis ATPase subunit
MLDTSTISAANAARDAITVANVSKWFPTADGKPLHVLDGVTLDVPEHAIVAILGASGSGKSTLLNIISGLVTPDRGRVCINGVASGEFRDWRSVSYMFQEDRLLPWRTACRNVEFALEAGAMPKADRRARALEALELVGLSGFADAFPYQLSGGMTARLGSSGFARAPGMTITSRSPCTRVAIAHSTSVASKTSMSSSTTTTCFRSITESAAMSAFLPSPACFRIEITACQNAQPPRVTLISFTVTPAVRSACRIAA